MPVVAPVMPRKNPNSGKRDKPVPAEIAATSTITTASRVAAHPVRSRRPPSAERTSRSRVSGSRSRTASRCFGSTGGGFLRWYRVTASCVRHPMPGIGAIAHPFGPDGTQAAARHPKPTDRSRPTTTLPAGGSGVASNASVVSPSTTNPTNATTTAMLPTSRMRRRRRASTSAGRRSRNTCHPILNTHHVYPVLVRGVCALCVQ
ncbi:hypothetical protein RU06_09225 [Curtobacterium flaccumfaciens]|nr:hypothetical protein RU06_09225 [Curtobacterium flaccumfaciens]